jgi:Transglycosylase SLT domain
MKLLLFATLLIMGSAWSVLGQVGSSYRVDNFDFKDCVRVELPPAQPVFNRRSRKLATSRNLVYPRPSEPLTQVTGMNMANLNTASPLEGYTTGNADIDNFIVESGRQNAVDPLLLYSIMHQESTFKRRALSPKGARGLMQLMPQTAARFGVSSIFDPRQNIEGGARYVRFLLDQFDGDVNLALAGYNAGEGAVMKYGNRIPPYAETQEYVRRISRRYSLIRDPFAASSANRLTRNQLATVQKESKPLTIYERSVFAVRLPDGSLQLVSQ